MNTRPVALGNSGRPLRRIGWMILAAAALGALAIDAFHAPHGLYFLASETFLLGLVCLMIEWVLEGNESGLLRWGSFALLTILGSAADLLVFYLTIVPLASVKP